MTTDRDLDRRVGVMIGAGRLYRDMTQLELADAAGISIYSVMNYENGVTKPEVPVLRWIAAALEIPERLFVNPPTTSRDANMAIAGAKRWAPDKPRISAAR